LAEHLMRGDLHDRHLETVSVTVSEVRMSRDLRHAQVFVAELGEEVQPATLDALARVAPFLAGRLAREMNLKYAPKLRFEPDTSFSYAARIDSLLSEGLRPHRVADGKASEPGDPTDGGDR
jgi:ribosome-binding factor A